MQDKTKPSDTQLQRFRRFTWGVVIYLIGVILWGAWVRITGSGAGCGNHWPTCHGEVIPLEPTLQTMIEFTHRLSSGLSLPLVLVALVWAFRLFPTGHAVRWSMVGTLIFLLSESALGAGLVKFDLVADNASLARAIVASLHLINTFTLVAFAVLAARWAKNTELMSWQKAPKEKYFLVLGLGLIMLTSMSGAVTALGDTLFPTSIFAEEGFFARLNHDLSGTTHFLVQLRIIHPIIALGSAVYLLWLTMNIGDFGHQGIKKLARSTLGIVISQVGLGSLNILLGAPGWLQIFHLLMAVSLWLHLVLILADFLTLLPEVDRVESEGPLPASIV